MARKLAPDKWLFAATTGLALFGVVMVYSASAVIAERENGNQFYYVIKQGVWVAIGFGVMLLMMQFNYQQLKNRRLVYGSLLLCTVALMSVFAFSPTNGAHRWLKFPGFSMQPSELSKLALIIFLAYFLEKRAGEEGDFWRTFVPCGVVTGGLAALVVIEPDFGTAMMLVLIFAVVIYTAGARVLHLVMAAAPALVVAGGLLIFVSWRFKRLVTFLDPWADQQGAGFQVVQSLIAIGSGGSNGLGFAQGKQKMLYLPFAHSDFIFAVVGEELGLVGALTVIAMFALFLWRGVRTALLAPDRFGMLLSFGIVASIVVQALFNISVVLSLVPTLAAVGILLNVSQHASGNIADFKLPIANLSKKYEGRLNRPSTVGN